MKQTAIKTEYLFERCLFNDEGVQVAISAILKVRFEESDWQLCFKPIPSDILDHRELALAINDIIVASNEKGQFSIDQHFETLGAGRQLTIFDQIRENNEIESITITKSRINESN